ncbi:hypothetical protein POX_g09166 [Penicillium oxalicum]|uniref:hypothetical protein n=1 Tax=Penicillium oxalicum TaxID=69781 RepID=UPI0020B87C7E|nr:hypothetical protein POX_g09166 [Penicillium oxalicum]KAI2786773.1 hypothetical protein POX_g09166 [Penicillium oxalicum]
MDAIVGYRVVGPLTVHRKIKDVEEFVQLALTKVVDEVLSQQYSDQVLGLLEREEEPLSCEPTVPWDCNEGAEIPLEVLLKAPNAVLKVIPSQKLNAVSVTKLQNVPVHVLQHATVEVLQKLPIPTLIGLGSVPPHVLQSAPLSVLTDMPVTKLEKMGNVPSSVLQLAPLDVLLRAPVYVLESTPVELSLEVPVESLLRGQATHINGLTRMQTTRASINGNSAPASQGLQADFSWVKKVNKKLELFGVKASWVQFTNVDIAAFSLQSNGMAE